MRTVLSLLTTAAIALVVYHHALYPVLLGWLARRRRVAPVPVPARRHRALDGDAALPSVAILVPAFNEAAVIAEKIRNLAALDYPPGRLEVIVACDGCTDDTAARARAAAMEIWCRHLRVGIRELTPNRGKLAALNAIVPALDAELVALSDASALISVDALLIAARHFAEARVGAVCATYRLLEPGSAGEADYWRYQTRLKESEAALGAPLGAHGAFYVLRARLFRPLPPDTINDDFILPMRVVLEGYACRYEPRMVAVELERATLAQDHRRRRRIAAGNVQQALRLPGLLHPRHGGVAFAFASGKALRAAMPFLLASSLAGSLALAPRSTAFALAAAAQMLGWALALLRHALPGRRWPKPIDRLHYVASGHLAGLVGATRYLLGREGRGWPGASHGREGPPPGDTPRPGHVHPLVAVAKRAVDVAAASALLALTAPLFPLIALAVRLDSPGPALYRQLRIGESRPDHTRIFQILKFRTMQAQAGAPTGATWATDDDPRITRVGRFLRRSRLDELPQLVNVLRGEMSLVGPRPEQPAIVRWLIGQIPYYGERTYGVKPGITGFAQVSQGYDRSLDDVRAKLGYDHAYALSLSRPRAWLALELSIMARTLLVMARCAGQ